MATTTPKPIIVCGATGKQGKSVITNILASPEADQYTLLALTRDANSSSAKALAARSPTIKLLQGNQDAPEDYFKSALDLTNGTPIWGVFSVQVPMGSGQTPVTEEKQGKDLIDAAIAHDVQVFVYTSVDRGGDVVSDTTPTNIPHFISKYHIEQHLKAQTRTHPMTYTILRPVAFMDGLTPDFAGKVMATWLSISLSAQKPLAFVAVTDIGTFAAQAFLHSVSADYQNQAISLAGDQVTVPQLNGIFQEKLGYAPPKTFEALAWVIKWFLTDLRLMFEWFETEGFGFDRAKLRRLHPGMMDVGTWVDKEARFERK